MGIGRGHVGRSEEKTSKDATGNRKLQPDPARHHAPLRAKPRCEEDAVVRGPFVTLYPRVLLQLFTLKGIYWLQCLLRAFCLDNLVASCFYDNCMFLNLLLH